MKHQYPEPSLQPPPILTVPCPEYDSSTRQWQGIPGIERAPNGRLWAVWYSGGEGEGPDNYVAPLPARTTASPGRSQCW